jgi:cytochrome oxidase Cu insertion factor (SCO1/SenC/PrrC family)
MVPVVRYRPDRVQEESVIRIPTPTRRAIPLLIAAPFIVIACSDGAADDQATSAPPAASAAAAADPSPDTALEAGSLADDTAAADATWLDIELTDAASGETFTLASLKGQVVALEPMAIWCTNCKAQQDNVKEVYAAVQDAGVRYISLGIDPNEDPDSLARYAERREYPWTFSQSSNEFARALSDEFGPQILSPPSTPLIVLDAESNVAVQEFGFHGPEKLLELLSGAAT